MHVDSWALKAKKFGYRTRAVFKLDEIIQKTKVLKKSQYVLDIGSAPGGWSQYIKQKSKKSEVYALDILDMELVEGVNFYQESIENIDSIDSIFALMGSFNLVISDIAPNLTGINAIDTENIYELNVLTLEVAARYLDKCHGSFIMKTFQNSMLKSLRKKMELSFKIVQTFKPAASKKQSGEIYLYGAYK
jgi:23S rRNA (uridine2552-2'-O)-methyltransferase